jgi:5-methyltetrahydropteroyltriglutamate--homocysteine methyltransferase
MKGSSDRILTTHAGSLPRPDDLTRMLYDVGDGKPVDQEELERRTREAIAEVVAKQREVGIDVVSDGEQGKVGFSNYVLQRFTGFEEEAQFMAADLGDFPEMIPVVFGQEYSQHLRLPVLKGPIEPRDPTFVQREIEDFKAALGDVDPDDAFLPAVSPGHVAFNFPNKHYPSHRAYLEAAAEALAPEYRAIVDAGFNVQIDSPDAAMAFHCRVEGSDLADPREHLAAGIDVLRGALRGIPAEKVRYHVCWGNVTSPHHRDVELKEIADLVLQAPAKFIYVEAANPRHEHEWEVWKEVTLPDDKALIVGVVDVKTNHVEHPHVVAQRIERFAEVVGRERVIAGTDCGFATFVGMHHVFPRVAWLKLDSLVKGAQVASERLWSQKAAAAG